MNEQHPILVVDDDELFRQTLVGMISEFHPKVIPASTAEEALALFKTHHPKIVFADVNMPGMSGVELARLLVNSNPEVLVAVLTGRSDEQLAISAIKAGASDYLRKPVSLRDLKAVLDRFTGLVDRRSSKQLTPESLQRVKLLMEIETSSSALQPAVSQIVRSIEGLVDRRELMRIEVALQETVRNAFEHGNLGITYDEKMELCNNGTLEEEIARRSEQARAAGKSILIDVTVEKNTLRVQVTDQGEGFDWRAVPDPTENPELLTGLHGRGIFLIRRCFDQVTYNDVGNSIILERTI